MGNSSDIENDPYFKPKKYANKGLTYDEILCIRTSFL